MTIVRMAAWGGKGCITVVKTLTGRYYPGLLVSYLLGPHFLEVTSQISYRDWVMDSGAYSAHTRGIKIVLQEYIDFCKQAIATNTKLTEVYSLDVISDWRASKRNTDAMWKQGVEAIPTYHQGEPWDVLLGLARDYPKIAIGGMVDIGGSPTGKLEWCLECFSRVWPKRIHGFGISNVRILHQVPFESVDSTNWAASPNRHGNWFGISPKGRRERLRTPASYDVGPEVKFYLRLERKLAVLWKRELSALPGVQLAPCVASTAL